MPSKFTLWTSQSGRSKKLEAAANTLGWCLSKQRYLGSFGIKLTHTGINFLINFLDWISTVLHLRSQRSLGSCISRETEPPTLSSKGCFVELIVAASSFALKIEMI